MTTRDPASAMRDADPAQRAIVTAAGWGAWKRAAAFSAPFAIAVGFTAQRTFSGVLAKVGHAAAPLDDAYIHFQYARAIAEGHPMRFFSGEPITSGATSMLWPALLAPFWAIGLRDDAIVWAAWTLSFAALGGLAWETAKLTQRLAGHAAAVGAGAMIVAFGGFIWCAASGMEVVPFAWTIARATRRAAEWSEAQPAARTPKRRMELFALAFGAALLRPEGVLTALFVTTTLAAFPRRSLWRDRASALVPAAAALAPTALLLLVTGSARSNTAIAKLLLGHPYYAGPALWQAVQSNVKVLVGTLLNGEVWSAEFLPHGGAPIAVAGLGAVSWLGARGQSRWRAVGVLLIALTILAPCFYVTFLWNRLRYVWPFATGWIIGLACLARVAGDLAARIRPRWRVATPIACGIFVGLFASKLEGVLDDIAQSASGIDRQQVALGRWAKENLPPDARVGVNDTGAIAYFGQRKTFDIVGLTTHGEARYWVAGAASRLEHYERLHATSPDLLPTHFIVYPEWMAMDAVLGESLHEATVADATILGGQTMRAYTADWSALGSGEQPWTAGASDIVDTLDVADLDSEEEHAYELRGARDGEEILYEGVNPDGRVVVDGGRTHRTGDRFVVHLRDGVAARVIVRLQGSAKNRVRVLANGEPISGFDIGDDEWVERSFEVPARIAAKVTRIELRVAGPPISTFHYWFMI
ncbi:MAG: hypothetical protein M3O46_17970 [Myxococcota bacterium]|nr:hypothetical protein [Myxococcota bacterium]